MTTTENQLARWQIEALLDAHKLQMRGRGGRWYDIRRNGATQRWKREPLRASIPCKVGFREAFRIEFNAEGRCYEWLRERPLDFDARTRD